MMGENLPGEQPVDYAVTTYAPESKIEVISMTDERLKILGEELANDTSRAILNSIMEGKRTAGEIATALNLSMPLVVYHIQRLLKSNIIRIDGVELNSKGREKKIYDIRKTAIIIQIDPTDSALGEKLRRLFILSTTVAVIGIISVTWQAAELQNQITAIVSDPDRPSFIPQISLMIPLALTGVAVAVSGALAWATGWLKRKK